MINVEREWKEKQKNYFFTARNGLFMQNTCMYSREEEYVYGKVNGKQKQKTIRDIYNSHGQPSEFTLQQI
jgi:hypothetical protein